MTTAEIMTGMTNIGIITITATGTVSEATGATTITNMNSFESARTGTAFAPDWHEKASLLTRNKRLMFGGIEPFHRVVHGPHSRCRPQPGGRVNGELRVENDNPGHELRASIAVLDPTGFVGDPETARKFPG